MYFIKQLIRFGWQQALCCIFPAVIFALLAGSKLVDIPYLARYDFILLMCVITQYGLIKSGLESWEEFKVIMLFHLIGLCLELYKVHMGSWSYPEAAVFKVGGVPLYSGFMYASVASYIVQAWRRFDLRWYITALLLLIIRQTWVSFQVGYQRYQMPMNLSFLLIGFFIWIAENISTFLGAWQYPNQEGGWQLVHLGKISSWFLLVVISVIIVANLKLSRPYKA